MTVYHVRDITNVDVLTGTERIDLRCIIVSRNRSKKVLFLNLQDETGVFQAAVERDLVPDQTWNHAVDLRPGESVTLRGSTSQRYKTAHALLDEIERLVVPSEQEFQGSRAMHAGSATSQAYAARLQSYTRALFESDGYVEIVPRFITSTLPPALGVYPLHVLYEGYGSLFHITPSPVPQLIRALATTPYERIFAVSRCFTHTYRDPVVSVESVIISGIVRKGALVEMLKRVDEKMRALFLLPGTRTERTINWRSASVRHIDSFESIPTAAVDEPEIQVSTQTGDENVSRIGRLCWPRHPEMHSDFSEYVLAEGYASGGIDHTAFAVVTVNVDRLLTLIFERADLRRMPAIKA